MKNTKNCCLTIVSCSLHPQTLDHDRFILFDMCDLAEHALTWGSKQCSSCSYSYRDVAEGGNMPECEQGYVQWSVLVWEQPAGEAGRGQPQREWQVVWGMQHRLWGETDLQKERGTACVECMYSPVECCEVYESTERAASGGTVQKLLNVPQHIPDFDALMTTKPELDLSFQTTLVTMCGGSLVGLRIITCTKVSQQPLRAEVKQ